jgi:hypothetical protein
MKILRAQLTGSNPRAERHYFESRPDVAQAVARDNALAILPSLA